MKDVGAFDTIVVGSGSAGAIVASRLSEDTGRSVLLLEAGGWDRNPAFHIPAAHGLLFKTRYDWDYETVPQPHVDGRAMFWPRGKVVGGCSSTNSMVYIRGHRADYDGWAAAGNEGWSFDEVLPYFKISENQSRGPDRYHAVGGPMHVIDPASPNPVCRAIVDAAVEMGLPRNDDFNGATQEGMGTYQRTQRRGLRWSVVDGYLRPAKRRRNLTIITGAQATRIAFDARRARHIEFLRSGTLARATAEQEIVLCAGAIGSPQLLMLSGIGPPAMLDALGIPVVSDLSGVGQNLQDHVQVPLIVESPSRQTYSYATLREPRHVAAFLLKRQGPMTTNVVETGGFVRTTPDEPVPNIQFHFAPAFTLHHGFEMREGFFATLFPVLLRPKSSGWLRLRSADPTCKPEIHANYFAEESDVDQLVAGLRLARKIAAQPALRGVLGDEVLPGPREESDAALRAHVRRTVETVYHPVGTCRMGSDPLAVVDSELRVHGVDGLRVADASVMPSIVGGNTHAPTMMIGERAAALIRERPLPIA